MSQTGGKHRGRDFRQTRNFSKEEHETQWEALNTILRKFFLFTNRVTCLKVIEKAQSQLSIMHIYTWVSSSQHSLQKIMPLFSWAIHICSWPALQGRLRRNITAAAVDGPVLPARELPVRRTACQSLSTSYVHPWGRPLLPFLRLAWAVSDVTFYALSVFPPHLPLHFL